MNPSAVAALVRTSYDADLGAFLPERVPVDELPAVFDPFAAGHELPFRYPGRTGVRAWLDREFRRYDPAGRRATARLSPGEADGLMTAPP